MTKKKPFLKWAGNKYHCLEPILSALPKANRLIEPFAGSGAIFLNTDYPNYLLAEKNPDLVALFTYLKQEGEHFINDCQTLFSEKNNSENQYYALREAFNRSTCARERALLFLYLNRHGYNGLCRYNLKGGYNVPFGYYKKPYFPRQELLYFYQKSHHIEIIYSDFRDTFARAVPGDLIYCDPPYAPLMQTSNFSTYISQKFGEKEQILLAQLANEYAENGITVLISNHDTEFTRQHYQKATITSFSVKRMISCQATNRMPAKELLAIFSQARHQNH